MALMGFSVLIPIMVSRVQTVTLTVAFVTNQSRVEATQKGERMKRRVRPDKVL